MRAKSFSVANVTVGPPPQKITHVRQHEGHVLPSTWEYVGTVDVAGTQAGMHPRKAFTGSYYGVPRVITPGFGPTTWDVWVPQWTPKGKHGYTAAKIKKWQDSCPHVFHSDALALMEKWEADPRPAGIKSQGP